MRNSKLRIALAQLNLCVGDIAGNTTRVIAAANSARDELGADLVVFPELTLTSYPPEDLLLRPDLYAQIAEGLTRIGNEIRGIDVIVGFPRRQDNKTFNACALIRAGETVAEYHKQHLPNYSVFDEKRYFAAGSAPLVVDIGGVNVGLTICEDIWEEATGIQYRDAGADLIVNINASPFHAEKIEERRRVLQQRIRTCQCPIVYLNLVGGQDELVFDGASMVVDAAGELALLAPEFEEALIPIEFTRAGDPLAGTTLTIANTIDTGAVMTPIERVYRALTLGVRDYMNKNGFAGAVLGLSGGIDSALTLAIAVDALGRDRVEAIMMPSPYTAAMSLEDARTQAETLGVRYHVIPINDIVAAFHRSLKDIFAGAAPDTTEENIQARARGVLLMAFSNKNRAIVLATGNKSEMAVGYATLYGDMVGGFAPLKDVPKTLVYELARWRNTRASVIPERVIDRPPSAELKPDQKDTDTLPPYPVLDAILERYIELDQPPSAIIDAGFDAETVRRVTNMVDRNEYKRRQSAPGVRISKRAFGRDRRYPITSAYKEEIHLTTMARASLNSG